MCHYCTRLAISHCTLFSFCHWPWKWRQTAFEMWWHTRRFRLSAKRTSPFKSAGTSVHSNTGSRGVRINGSNAGHTMFRGSVKSTGYPLHSPVSPALPLPCVTVCLHISTGLYQVFKNVGTFQTLTKCQIAARISPPFIWIVLLTVLPVPPDTCICLADSIEQSPFRKADSL
jgi:hypothetical protein